VLRNTTDLKIFSAHGRAVLSLPIYLLAIKKFEELSFISN